MKCTRLFAILVPFHTGGDEGGQLALHVALAAGLLALPFVRFSRQGSQALMPPPAYDDARLLTHNALVPFHTGGD